MNTHHTTPWDQYLETPIKTSDPSSYSGITETTLLKKLDTFTRTRKVRPYSAFFLRRME